MRSRDGGRLALLLVLVASVAGACSKPKSFIVLTLRSADSSDIAGVTEVVVTVNQAPSLSKVLTYPTQPITINGVNTNDLSVSFAGGRSGPVDLSVSVKDASGCLIGFRGDLSVSIRQGDIASVAVDLTPGRTCENVDGGVDAGGEAFPGCDPVSPAPVCTATQTCQVNCMTKKGECTAGGTGAPGTPCMMNKDCAPGSQCFDYSGTGCTVKICLRFCNEDKACMSSVADGGASDGGGADSGAASSGPSSVCQGLVPCGMTLTPYHTCTFACDPRAKAAAAGSSGCPSGLSCLVVGDMDQVDCACAEATRTGVDGDDCATGAQCAPGFICNEMGTTKKCRAVCGCNAKDMTCTAPSDCPGGKTCSALKNDTTFGVCL